jgi:Family of unknown function (DUF6159)
MSEEVRCPSCGALNAEAAEWCGQCYARFPAPEAEWAPSEAPTDSPFRHAATEPQGSSSPLSYAASSRAAGAAPAPPGPRAGTTTRPRSGPPPPPPPPPPAPRVSLQEAIGGDLGGEGGLSIWNCALCGQSNPGRVSICSACGVSMMQGLSGGRISAIPTGPLGATRRPTPTNFLERLRRGGRLIKVSWQVLKLDPELLLFPLATFVAVIALAYLFLSRIAGVPVEFWGDEISRVSKPLLMVYFFSIYLVGVFCQASVVAGAMIRFKGGNPKLADGPRAAVAKILPLAGWALIASTVALAIRLLQDASRGRLTRMLVGMLDTAWQAATYFAVPAILFEDTSPTKAVKRSGQLFKKNWSETLVGMFGIGLAISLAMFALGVVSVLVAVYVSIAVGIGMLIFGFATLIVVGSTLSAICNAALYRYATTGEAPIPFSNRDLLSSGHTLS